MDDKVQSGRGAGPEDVQTTAPGGTPLSGGPAPSVAGPGPTASQMILFWASFLTLIAAGIGFSVRANILGAWGQQFGFTQTELGGITGGGLVGFGFTIIIFSFLADQLGYGKLMIIAFLFHFSSAIVTLAATPIYAAGYGKDGAYWCLFVGMFLFALGNGTCEAVINPLTATLFPRNKTHWLNILHAGWPGGLILGALLALGFNFAGSHGVPVRWEIQMLMFLIPTLAYGALMIGRAFPHSEAKAAGVGLGAMMLEVLAPILLFLILIHAMVGYVELGTDSWISNITGRILADPNFGLMLFIWTSGLMFILRFFAGPIVHKISPLGLLFCSAVLGCCGLSMLGMGPNVVWFCILAATVYGCGKTFFWPTMLGVVSERFPKGGALTLGLVGGIGMLSAGFLGGPGIGYKQDYFAMQNLQQTQPQAYARYKSEESHGFLFFPAIAGLDQSKVAVLNDNGAQLQQDIDNLGKSGRKLQDDKNLDALKNWWDSSAKDNASKDKDYVSSAGLYGGKMALTLTAAVPATMALCYLLLIIYFWRRGGYQAQVLLEHKANDEAFTGGVEGPAEM